MALAQKSNCGHRLSEHGPVHIWTVYPLEIGGQQRKPLYDGSWTEWANTSNMVVLLFNGKHCLCCYYKLKSLLNGFVYTCLKLLNQLCGVGFFFALLFVLLLCRLFIFFPLFFPWRNSVKALHFLENNWTFPIYPTEEGRCDSRLSSVQ